MELAEIYLEAPKIILLDRSLSSILASVAIQPKAVPMLNFPFDRRHLTVDDATVALAHPFNPALGIPTLKKTCSARPSSSGRATGCWPATTPRG
ncbi:MAG: hypothetical protein WBG38_14745 [Nodosilinea sp.]